VLGQAPGLSNKHWRRPASDYHLSVDSTRQSLGGGTMSYVNVTIVNLPDKVCGLPDAAGWCRAPKLKHETGWTVQTNYAS
jgi:hypothetical protein